MTELVFICLVFIIRLQSYILAIKPQNKFGPQALWLLEIKGDGALSDAKLIKKNKFHKACYNDFFDQEGQNYYLCKQTQQLLIKQI